MHAYVLVCDCLFFRFPGKHKWGVRVQTDDWRHENLRIRPSATNSYAKAKIYLTLNFEADSKIKRDTAVMVGRRYKMNVCMLSEIP